MAKAYSKLLNDKMHPPSFEAMVNIANRDLKGTGDDSGDWQAYLNIEEASKYRRQAFSAVMGREFDEDKDSDYDLLFAFNKIARENLYFSEATMSPEEMAGN